MGGVAAGSAGARSRCALLGVAVLGRGCRGRRAGGRSAAVVAWSRASPSWPSCWRTRRRAAVEPSPEACADCLRVAWRSAVEVATAPWALSMSRVSPSTPGAELWSMWVLGCRLGFGGARAGGRAVRGGGGGRVRRGSGSELLELLVWPRARRTTRRRTARPPRERSETGGRSAPSPPPSAFGRQKLNEIGRHAPFRSPAQGCAWALPIRAHAAKPSASCAAPAWPRAPDDGQNSNRRSARVSGERVTVVARVRRCAHRGCACVSRIWTRNSLTIRSFNARCGRADLTLDVMPASPCDDPIALTRLNQPQRSLVPSTRRARLANCWRRGRCPRRASRSRAGASEQNARVLLPRAS